MPGYSTGVVALRNPLELFKYVHFYFPLLSSKCLLSLLISNKLMSPKGKLFTNLRTFPARPQLQELQSSPTPF